MAEDQVREVTEELFEASRPLVALAVRSIAAGGDDLTVVQFRALVVLHRHGPLSLGALAGRIGLQAPTTTRLCDRLVRKELITRRRSPTSGRSIELNLTEHGAGIVQAVFDARRSALEDIVVTLTPEQQRAVRDALVTFATAARAVREQNRGLPEP